MANSSPEFDLIKRHFTRPAANAVLGVGDDCALVDVTNGMDLAVSVDTMVSGTHFFPDVNPENLGHKALAVNLSDIAAMGAMPYWAMLALTLPNVDHDWLAAFAKGFFDLAQEYNVSLIGGDTTRGPSLVMTVTIMGEVPAGAALRRSGAKPGNDVWVSGNVGDAALAVAHRYGRIVLEAADYQEAVMRLYEPSPRVALGQALRGLATAAIDISDGLLADLTHICRLSEVGATVDLNSVPVSSIGLKHINSDEGRNAILAGGDDYELCFTAHPNSRDSIEDLTEVLGIPITRIGQIKRGKGVSLLGPDGKAVKIDGRGYDHFKGA
jgi:thiamine-monophosphate kinase